MTLSDVRAFLLALDPHQQSRPQWTRLTAALLEAAERPSAEALARLQHHVELALFMSAMLELSAPKRKTAPPT